MGIYLTNNTLYIFTPMKSGWQWRVETRNRINGDIISSGEVVSDEKVQKFIAQKDVKCVIGLWMR